MQHPSVIRIPVALKNNYKKVQQFIGAPSQPETLEAVIGWLTNNSPEAQEALKAVARYRADLCIARATTQG